jgi:hypothetical protein
VKLLALTSPHRLRCGSSRFSPPVCYQLSQARTSSLLRIHLPPSTASVSLESPLVPPYPSRFIPVGTMQGFPSYCGLPVSRSTLNHVTGLIRYWASRLFARLPSRAAVSGSLALCAAHFLSLPSDPAVTSNALAIWIVFPLIRVTPASFSRPGLPAPLGKQIRQSHC